MTLPGPGLVLAKPRPSESGNSANESFGNCRACDRCSVHSIPPACAFFLVFKYGSSTPMAGAKCSDCSFICGLLLISRHLGLSRSHRTTGQMFQWDATE